MTLENNHTTGEPVTSLKNKREVGQYLRRISLWGSGPLIIIIGLVLTIESVSVGGIEVGPIITNLGVTAFVILATQWFYDRFVRDDHFEELTKRGTDEISRLIYGSEKAKSLIDDAGLDEVVANPFIDMRLDDETILQSKEFSLVFGFGLAPWYKFSNVIIARSKKGLHTSIYYLCPSSDTCAYLEALIKPKSEVEKQLNFLKSSVDALREHINRSGYGGEVKIYHHHYVIKYTLIHLSSASYISIFPNADGLAAQEVNAPIFKVINTGSIRSFIEADLANFQPHVEPYCGLSTAVSGGDHVNSRAQGESGWGT